MESYAERVATVTDRNDLQTAFVHAAGWAGCNSVTVAGDASNRRYERLKKADGKTAILMDAPPDKGEDVTPFVHMAEYLIAHGLSAPHIYVQDARNGFLLIEDLGDALFARLMTADPARQTALYTSATDVLVTLHTAPIPKLPVCDVAWLSTMTDPVFDWYAQGNNTDMMVGFRALFYPLAATLDHSPKVIILRDYHAENLLWLPDRTGVAQVGLLDFQDALLGHPAYDLVSILQDARRDVDVTIEHQMIDHYLAQSGADATAFRTAYAILGTQRNLRILGIFARLCLQDGKAHYVDMIPRVWGYVMRNLEHPELRALATFIHKTLPPPTPEFLEHLKSQCATRPLP